MGEDVKRAVTRRALLAGAGGVAGAAALSVGAADPASAAEPPALGPGDPIAGRGARARSLGLPPLAVTPGLHHRVWGQYDVQPNYSALGKAVSPYGAFCTAADGNLVVGLGLEADLQLTEVAFAINNSSGASVDGILEYNSFDGSALGVNLATVPVASGGATTIQFGSSSLNHRTSAANFYDAALFTKASGSVRIWGVRLSYVPNGYGFTPVTPTRVYDSRAADPPGNVTKGQLSNGTRVIDMLNGLSPPVAPKGVICNLTVVNTSFSGFLALYRNGIAWPGTSSINWFVPDEVVANSTYTDVDAAGKAVAKVPVNSSTDFFVDVVGYYA